MAMASESSSPSPSTRRPVCAKCTKPVKLCLCSRFTSPPLDNSTSITVLQHTHEIKHPLNSTRIAKLGFKNISVIHISDVHLHAQLEIYPLKDDLVGCPTRLGSSTVNGEGEKLELWPIKLATSDGGKERLEFDNGTKDPKPGNGEGERLDLWPINLTASDGGKERLEFDNGRENPKPGKGSTNAQLEVSIDSGFAVVSSCNGVDTGNCIVKDMNKYKVVCSPTSLNITVERTAKPNLNWVLNTPIGNSLINNGFRVKKLHTKKKNNSTEIYEILEYDITVPPKSVLLFPNENSVGLDSVDFEVKNVIVLDGTWGKAQRMYHENPWLKVLPHVKLDLKKESLYNEVRHQPKSGCLSTIESIIFALKKFGEDSEGLDSILGVFESMILDQRRCKDERFSASS